MTTRNIVPRATGEGGIGTTAKRWALGWINALSVNSLTLGVLGIKNPPIDADKALYRDSAASDAIVTSTWAQIKAFLKTYFDTIYNLYVHPNHSGDVTSVADGAQTIAANAVTNAKLATMATKTYKGRTSTGTGNAEDVAMATLKTDLSLNNVENTTHSTDAHIMTIDGRDVSVDGSKLDDIEASAVALVTVKADADIASAISLKHTQNTDTDLSPAHKDAATGVHGVGANTLLHSASNIDEGVWT